MARKWLGNRRRGHSHFIIFSYLNGFDGQLPREPKIEIWPARRELSNAVEVVMRM
jgi:hypothetical protein